MGNPMRATIKAILAVSATVTITVITVALGSVFGTGRPKPRRLSPRSPARRAEATGPLWHDILRPIRLVCTAFVCLLVPIYWREYGPGNFLWFSDIALLFTLAALWTESAFLASMAAVGALALESLWTVDFLTGGHLVGLAAYMFDAGKPLYLRALSLFHLGLPPLLLWLLYRLGYDRRALKAQTILAWIVLPLTYLATDPERNINWVFGPGAMPQDSLPPPLYLGLLMIALPAFVYLPSHWALQRFFARPGTVSTARCSLDN